MPPEYILLDFGALLVNLFMTSVRLLGVMGFNTLEQKSTVCFNSSVVGLLSVSIVPEITSKMLETCHQDCCGNLEWNREAYLA